MIYLIGGPPRVGKSSLARLMLERLDVSGVSTDALVQMLEDDGVPDYFDRTKSRLFRPYLERFEVEIADEGVSYVIEGDALWPDDVPRESRAFRIIFLGMRRVSLTSLLDHAPHWVNELSDSKQRELPERIVEASAEIRQACERLELSYVNMNGDRSERLELAYRLLTGKK